MTDYIDTPQDADTRTNWRVWVEVQDSQQVVPTPDDDSLDVALPVAALVLTVPVAFLGLAWWVLTGVSR
jgi:hypothetical protein